MGGRGREASPRRKEECCKCAHGEWCGRGQAAQARGARELFWDVLRSQRQQNPTHPAGNGNCEGAADTSALLRSQLRSQHAIPSPTAPRSFRQLTHPRASAHMLLTACGTEETRSHSSGAGLGQSETPAIPQAPTTATLLPARPQQTFWAVATHVTGAHSLAHRTHARHGAVTVARHTGARPGSGCQGAAAAAPARGPQAGQRWAAHASPEGKGAACGTDRQANPAASCRGCGPSPGSGAVTVTTQPGRQGAAGQHSAGTLWQPGAAGPLVPGSGCGGSSGWQTGGRNGDGPDV